MKTVSVAMATYNGARFIREQLDSLARQTVLPAELVITDDGSTDNTLEIVADFAARAPFPVRVERNPENLGFRANFMKAASLCTSDLIAFCDQDDIWLPHKIETCLELFDNDNVSMGPWMVCHGFTNVIAKSLLAHMNFWPQSQNFFDVGLRESHDQWFPCLAGVLGTTGYISAPLALYRRHQATVTVDRAEISLRQRFKGKFGTHLDGLLSRENCAAYRAFVMETIAASPDASRIDQVVRAAHLYRNLESYYRQRREMYQTNGHLKRLRLLIALARSGCYRPQAQWGVGARALARDIFSGICFGASGTAA